jgi:hypothetical protein
MTQSLTWNRAAIGIVAVLVAGASFSAGFIACLHAKTSTPATARAAQLQLPGDASAAVRSEIVATLQSFQDGYVRRDVSTLDTFMSRHFSKDGEVVLLGTECGASEWIRGVPAAKHFIQNDWQNWGDFRFDAEHAVINSTGNVAWVASLGSVRFNTSSRPVRFTAVLAQEDNRWIFRHLQFDWDDRDPRPEALLHPGTYLHVARSLMQ